jgi:hypothetical protein
VPTILLDKPRPVDWTKWPPVAAGEGIEFGTIGDSPSNRWVTTRGSFFVIAAVSWAMPSCAGPTSVRREGSRAFAGYPLGCAICVPA